LVTSSDLVLLRQHNNIRLPVYRGMAALEMRPSPRVLSCRIWSF